MGVSDRLYELSCECRDTEEALDRLRREIQQLEAIRRAAGELVECLEEAEQARALTANTRGALAGLKALE